LAFFVKEGVFKGKTANLEGTMKIRKVFLLAIIAVLLGMVTACDELTNSHTVSVYTVSFEANGGSPAPQNQTISQGGKVTEPASMTQPGYGFGGWYKEAAFSNLWNFDSDIVTDNITLYAKWDYNYYNCYVSFEANGGSPAPQNQTISQGGKVTEPATMTKAGYGFAGWYKEETFINLWNFDNDTVTYNNTTLYAKWDSNYHTVSFVTNGGNPVPQQQNIVHGYKASKPQDMIKGGYIFEGWYKEAAFTNLWNFNSDNVTTNIVLYAKWGYIEPTIVQGTTLADKLQWLNSNAASNNTYILEVSSDEYLNHHTLSYSGKSNISIQLIGIGGVKTIELYGSGPLFTIERNVTLSLNENIVLEGPVTAASGNLIMNNGSKITSGGVSVAGTFIMNGGEISGNTSSSYNGIVYVDSYYDFTGA
jgi:uncharacterized repeat protein (TIGR02543 family)